MSLMNRFAGNSAAKTKFRPNDNIPFSDIERAVKYIFDNAAAVGTVYADKSAQFITAASEAGLDSERVATDTALISWDFGTSGQAKANWAHLGIESLADPGADRGIFWDDSAGATAFFSAGTGMGFVGTQLSMTDGNVVAITKLTLGAASADKALYFTAEDTAAYYDITAFARTLLDDADAGTVRATLGLDTLGGIDNVDTSSLADGQLLAYDAGVSQWLPVTFSDLSGGGSAFTDAPYYTTAAHAGSTAETVVPAFMQTLLDDTSASAARTTLGLAIGSDVQAWSAILDAATAAFTTADETKLDFITATSAINLDFITVTQAVNLDTMESDIAALGSVVSLRGTWDASSGSFPGSGSAQAGYSYIVDTGGTVDGQVFTTDDRIVAITDNASTSTYASNWHKLDYTDQVQSVAGKTGAVTLASGDLTDVTAFAETLLDDANAAAARTTLGVDAAGTDNSTAVTLAGTPDYLTLSGQEITLTQIDMTTDITGATPIANGGTAATNATNARTNLGLAIGTNVQAYDTGLQSIAGLTTAADRMIYTTASDTYAVATLTSFARTLLDDTTASAARTTLGVDAAGTDNSTAVTLAGTPDYITLSGQELTLGQIDMTADITGKAPPGNLDDDVVVREIPFIIDGAGSAITTGVKGYIRVPFNGTITGVTMLADQSGSAVVDIWKDTYANYPPVDADSITASAVPTISTATKSQDTTLTGWTTSITAGDILGFNVDSATTITLLTITLEVDVT